jgi:hypothetical protein
MTEDHKERLSARHLADLGCGSDSLGRFRAMVRQNLFVVAGSASLPPER